MQASDYAAATQFGASRVERYAEAEFRFPNARSAELVFALCAVGATQHRDLVDVSVGTGFLWRALHARFRHGVMLDESPAMVENAKHRLAAIAPEKTLEFQVRRMQEVRPGVVSECDVLGCQAALHHLVVRTVVATCGLPAAWQYEVEQTRALHLETVKGWFETLRPDGVLFIADVAPPSLEEMSRPRCDSRWPHRPVGHWFDEAVHKFGVAAHPRHYTDTAEVRQRLESLGAEILVDAVLPTPWLFETREDAVWFVNELFSLTPEAVPFDERHDLAGRLAHTAWLVDTYLGLESVAGGKTRLGWSLWGIVARKPEAGGI